MPRSSRDAVRIERPSIPMQPVAPMIHIAEPHLYHFGEAIRLARQRVGVWRLNAYLSDAYIVGDFQRRTDADRWPWQRGYFYGVVGDQVVADRRVLYVYEHLAHITISRSLPRADHELWWFAVAPKWELAAFHKTLMLDAPQED